MRRQYWDSNGHSKTAKTKQGIASQKYFWDKESQESSKNNKKDIEKVAKKALLVLGGKGT